MTRLLSILRRRCLVNLLCFVVALSLASSARGGIAYLGFSAQELPFLAWGVPPSGGGQSTPRDPRVGHFKSRSRPYKFHSLPQPIQNPYCCRCCAEYDVVISSTKCTPSIILPYLRTPRGARIITHLVKRTPRGFRGGDVILRK